MSDTAVLRTITARTQEVAAACVDGVTHEESLLVPAGGGNGMNWVLGHLVHVNEAILHLLGATGTLPSGSVDRYAPGSPAITPAEAHTFEDLRATLRAQTPLLDAAWATVTEEGLQSPPPPGFDSLTAFFRFIVFHQAYHTGQCGMLRRHLGRDRAFG